MIAHTPYQVILLGAGVATHGGAFQTLCNLRLEQIASSLASVVRYHRSNGLNDLVKTAPTVVVYLGGDTQVDANVVAGFVDEAVPVVPVVADLKRFSTETPPSLHGINGTSVDWVAPDFTEVVNVVLENLALLRRDRRLFISYRRCESQAIAHQLRIAFDDAGYDTFLDLSSVPKADDFQSVLWHRLLDSDVMVLLDTPGFLGSRWTREEVAQAFGMSVGVLRVAWPEVPAERFAELAAHELLKEADLVRATKPAQDLLEPRAMARIVSATEGLRARNVAARHDNLVGEFCDAADLLGIDVTVQPGRFVLVRARNGQRIAIVPTVGVPDAQRFHDASLRFPVAGDVADEAVLLYDHRGMHGGWRVFLEWLDQHLPVKGVRATAASDFLRGLS